ncbi:MAG: hypothetical protein ACLGHZ_04090 [Actinomycetes bacterium]
MTTDSPAPRGNLTLGIVLGVIAGLVAVILGWWALQPQLTGQPAPSPSASASPSRTPTPRPTPTASPTPSPTPSETASATPSESAPPSPIPGIVTSLPPGSWITVLDSLRQGSTTPEQAIARAQELTFPGYQTVAIDTSAFSNLNPGYYAIVIPGAATRADVSATCQAIGIPVGDDCYARQIPG